MNRRAFLTGLLASSALAPVAVRAAPAAIRSLWQVSWGEQSAALAPDGFEVYTSRFEWLMKGTTDDWRYVASIANIDTDDSLVSPDIFEKMGLKAGNVVSFP